MSESDHLSDWHMEVVPVPALTLEGVHGMCMFLAAQLSMRSIQESDEVPSISTWGDVIAALHDALCPGKRPDDE